MRKLMVNATLGIQKAMRSLADITGIAGMHREIDTGMEVLEVDKDFPIFVKIKCF